MAKVKVASTSEITSEKVLKVKAEGQTVLITQVDGHYCAVANKCPHLGLPMSKGKFVDGVITCPFHGSKFEVATGKNVGWIDSAMGVPLPGFAKKMMAMGKDPVDVASFNVTQEGEELFVEV